MRKNSNALILALAGKKPKSRQVVTGYRSRVQGWRTIGGQKHYFRSLWEIQFAQYLQWLVSIKQIKMWEYEPLLFTFPKDAYRAGPFEYLPDFRVVNADNTIVWYEVKGWMNNEAKKKLARFNKHYPDETMIIIGKEWFTSARKKNLHLICAFEKLV